MSFLSPAPEGWLRQRLQAFGPFIVVLGLVALMWALVLVSSAVQQERIANDAQQQLRLINNAVVQQTRGLLQRVEGELQVLDHWVQSHPQNDPRQDMALAELISQLDAGTNGLVSLGFASHTGHAIATPQAQDWHADMPAVIWPLLGSTHIGAPLRNAVGQPWRWPVSRRLTRPTGDVAGVVAWIDLARLSTLHESLRDKPAGAITLTRSDATLIVRTPVIDKLIGRNLRQSGPTPLMPASASQGFFAYDGSLTDGQPGRVVSYERLGNYPVTVLVSQGVNDAMATFNSRRRILIIALSLISLCAFAFSVALARSQRASRRSQAEILALSDAFPLGFFRTDMTGQVTYANDAYFQKMGFARERMAWGWIEGVDASRQPELKEVWCKAVAEGRPLKNTLRIRRATDGREVVMSVRTAALRVDGKLVGQVGSMEDITDRIQQQKAQRMLTAIFEKSTDVVAQISPDGHMVYLNPAGRARLDLGPHDPLDQLHFEDFTPPGRAAQVRDVIIPAALGNDVWVGETSVLDSQKREIAMSEMLIVHRDDEGQIEAFSAVMRDITQEQQARDELQRSQSILNVVAATLPVLVAVVDDQQRYLFTNDAFDRSVGRLHDGPTGQHAREVISEAEYAIRLPHIKTALAGERVMFETERNGREGMQFFETTYIPFVGTDGKVAGFVALSQDITTHRLEQLKLLDASQTDALTGVLNRAGFDLRMQEALDRAQREKHVLALLCLDLDGFKPVNDAHGHAAGDAVLTAVARRLQRLLRPSDVLARVGGDEFAVVLHDVKDPAAAQAVARKIVNRLGEPFQIDDKTVHIGSSVGVALTANGQDSVQALMQRADAALYQAKRAGRGRFEMADDALPSPSHQSAG